MAILMKSSKDKVQVAENPFAPDHALKTKAFEPEGVSKSNQLPSPRYFSQRDAKKLNYPADPRFQPKEVKNALIASAIRVQQIKSPSPPSFQLPYLERMAQNM